MGFWVREVGGLGMDDMVADVVDFESGDENL